MLIDKDRTFIQAAFDSEAELESVVITNAEYIFGPSSIFLPKALIKTKDGFGTIPDGFAVDVSTRQWFIVEAELSKHSVWSHIAPQVAKQVIAATNPASRQLLADLIVDELRENESSMEKFTDECIDAIDVRRVLGEILEGEPIIGMPIDAVSNDLRAWAETFRVKVKLWIIRKYIEFGKPENVIFEIPEEYRPVLETGDEEGDSEGGIKRYEVSVADLIKAELLAAGDKLVMPYKPRNGQQRTYEGTIKDDGSIEVLGKVFSSPSFAALYGIQDAGSSRNTVNGWSAWRTQQGTPLAELRDRYLKEASSSEDE